MAVQSTVTFAIPTIYTELLTFGSEPFLTMSSCLFVAMVTMKWQIAFEECGSEASK